MSSGSGDEANGSGATEMVIDVRERDLIEAMQGRAGVRTATLDLGDIVLWWRGRVVLTIERKTLSDLASSIKDGRYHEQKLRLSRAADVEPTRTLYLLEGTRGIASDVLLGVVVNTMIRDRMKVYRTTNLADTVALLEKMRARLVDPNATSPAYFEAALGGGGNGGGEEDTGAAYAATIKRVKKDNLDARTCLISQLAQVPGVSPGMAAALVDRYHASCASDVCDALRQPDGERHLADVPWTTPSGRSRRIGPACARRLVEYLCGGGDDKAPAPKRARTTKKKAVEDKRQEITATDGEKACSDGGVTLAASCLLYSGADGSCEGRNVNGTSCRRLR